MLVITLLLLAIGHRTVNLGRVDIVVIVLFGGRQSVAASEGRHSKCFMGQPHFCRCSFSGTCDLQCSDLGFFCCAKVVPPSKFLWKIILKHPKTKFGSRGN